MKYFNVINSFHARCGYCDRLCKCYSHSYGFDCLHEGNIIIAEDRYGISIISGDYEICEQRREVETRLYDLDTRKLIVCVPGSFPITPGNFEHYVKRFKSLVAFS